VVVTCRFLREKRKPLMHVACCPWA
jgi:hypothetical protein